MLGEEELGKSAFCRARGGDYPWSTYSFRVKCLKHLLYPLRILRKLDFISIKYTLMSVYKSDQMYVFLCVFV